MPIYKNIAEKDCYIDITDGYVALIYTNAKDIENWQKTVKSMEMEMLLRPEQNQLKNKMLKSKTKNFTDLTQLNLFQ